MEYTGRYILVRDIKQIKGPFLYRYRIIRVSINESIVTEKDCPTNNVHIECYENKDVGYAI